MRVLLLSLVLVPTVRADQVNILPEARTDLKPTPRDATVAVSRYSYPESYKPLHDGKFPAPTPIPAMDPRKPADFLGDRRFFSPLGWGAVAVSPDGGLLACGGSGVVSLFDTGTGKAEARLFGDFDGVNWLRFAPDGKRLSASTGYGQVRVFDVAKKIELAAFQADSFTLTPDAKVCAGIEWEDVPGHGEKDGLKDRRRPVIRVRTTADWKCLSAISLGEFRPARLAISPDGKLLAVGGRDGTVRIIDPKEEKELATSEKLGEMVEVLEFHPNGKTVAAAEGDKQRGSDRPHRVHLWDFGGAKKATVLEPTIDTKANAEQLRYGKLGGVREVRFSADGKMLLTSDWSGTLRLWDSMKAVQLGKFHRLNTGPVATFTADGLRVYLCGATRPVALTVPDLKEVAVSPEIDNAPKVPFELHGEIPQYDARQKKYRALPGDELVQDGGYEKEPYAGVWLLAKGKPAHQFEPNRIVAWDVTPDGKTLACFGHNVDGQGFDHPVRFYDIATRQETAALRVYPKPGYALRFSPDGKRIAMPHHDGLVRVWDVATLKPLMALDPDGFYVDKLTFSKDGKKLVGGNDKSPVLVVWDVTDAKK